MIPRWRKAGYVVKLIFLSLPNAEMAVARVAVRVAQGGHNVSEEVVRRRFATGISNFHRVYKALVDSWLHYDNAASPPELLDQGGLQ